MAFRFNERHALSLVTPHLFPGEQVLHRARGIEKPWYSRVLWELGSLMWNNWLVVATNQRILFIRHRGALGGYRMQGVESYAWQQIGQVKLGWGVLQKTLSVRAPTIGLSRKIVLGRFWLPKNFLGGEGVASSWQTVTQMLAQNSSYPPPHALPGAPLPA